MEKRNIQVTGMVIGDEDKMAMIDAIVSGEVSYGKYNKLAEEKLAEYEDQDYAFLVNSGSSANLLAFASMYHYYNLQKGDEIITVACSFPTTISPIVQYGCVPVFVDVDETYNIDCSKLELTLSTKTKGVMIAHTLGIPYDIDTVRKFCKDHNLFLISDCCDALGSIYKKKMVTSKEYSEIVTNSFYPAHHISSGEGGAVLTSNKELATIIQSLRDWGRSCACDPGKDNFCGHRYDYQYGELPQGYDHKYVYSHLGYNLKATNIQAALLYSQLKSVNEFTKIRRRNFEILYKKLGTWCFPHHLVDGTYVDYDDDYYHNQVLIGATNPSWFGFPIMLPLNIDRKKVIQKLNLQGIGTRLLFAGNILKQPCAKEIEEYRVVGNLTMTDMVMNNMLWVGCAHILSIEDVLYEKEIIYNIITEELDKK